MVEINLRKLLVDWLKKRGHWAVLRVATGPRLSGLADDETGQPYMSIGEMAEARDYVDYIVKTDRRKVVPDRFLDTGIGDAAVGEDHFYLEHHSPVKEGDLILEVQLDSNERPITPFVIRKAYKVIDPQDMRDQNGRIEFYQCLVEQVNVMP